MNPPSALCRAQEAHHLARAANSSLANVRAIAETAAASWNKEALVAERREQRVNRQSPAVEARGEDELRSREQGDRSISENPDRGFREI